MRDDWPPLAPRERPLDDRDERLHRQAAPAHLEQDGTLSLQVFRPTKRDERQLSVSRGSAISAKRAYEEHTASGLKSLGTLSVALGQVQDDAGLRCIDDSALPDIPEAHAYIDFRPLTRRECNIAAEILVRVALENGWGYKPR